MGNTATLTMEENVRRGTTIQDRHQAKNQRAIANKMNIYACTTHIKVPHEVKNQRAVAMRSPQIMFSRRSRGK